MIKVCDYDCKNNTQLLGSRNKAIILMFLDTGLRASELANIKLDEIESERGWIKVKGNCHKSLDNILSDILIQTFPKFR